MEIGLLMTAGQRGQAIVAVMVVMLILFALAGAVAIGAESLLGRSNSATATTDDFRLRSAVNDSVAQVSGRTNACSAVPPPASPPIGPTPTPSPIPASVSLALPSPDDQARLTTQCVRMDGVTAGGLTSDTLVRLALPATACKNISLGLSGRVAVVFDVHTPNGRGDGGWAYVDTHGGSPPGQCLPPQDDAPCQTTFDRGWTQAALICDIPSGRTAELHLQGTATSPAQVFAAQESAQNRGSAYLLSIETPIANAREEAFVYVSGDGSTNRLLYEAPLQP